MKTVRVTNKRSIPEKEVLLMKEQVYEFGYSKYILLLGILPCLVVVIFGVYRVIKGFNHPDYFIYLILPCGFFGLMFLSKILLQKRKILKVSSKGLWLKENSFSWNEIKDISITLESSVHTLKVQLNSFEEFSLDINYLEINSFEIGKLISNYWSVSK